MVHRSSWAYLPSYWYHQPAQNLKNHKNLSRTIPGMHNGRSCTRTTRPNLGPSAKDLICQGRHMVHHGRWTYLSSY